MKPKLILIVILMTVIPIFSSAQTKSGDDSAPTGAANSLLLDRGPTNVLASPGSPGPQEVIQEYEAVMVSITQNFSANLAGIIEAVQEGK